MSLASPSFYVVEVGSWRWGEALKNTKVLQVEDGEDQVADVMVGGRGNGGEDDEEERRPSLLKSRSWACGGNSGSYVQIPTGCVCRITASTSMSSAQTASETSAMEDDLRGFTKPGT